MSIVKGLYYYNEPSVLCMSLSYYFKLKARSIARLVFTGCNM